MKFNEIPGLQGLYEEGGVWVGWAWITKIEHKSIFNVLPLLAEYKHPFADKNRIHNPLKELQIEFSRGPAGEQVIELTGIPQNFLLGLDVDKEVEDSELELKVREVLKGLLDECD